jgi:hypothetical protein
MRMFGRSFQVSLEGRVFSSSAERNDLAKRAVMRLSAKSIILQLALAIE